MPVGDCVSFDVGEDLVIGGRVGDGGAGRDFGEDVGCERGVCEDGAEGVEGVEGDSAVGGVRVVLDTTYSSMKSLRCIIHETVVDRRQNDGAGAEEMSN